jgi:two-component system sensor histidine kinase DesK
VARQNTLLIALKAELAGRAIGTDSGRAAAEIAELESVARQSLTDVRAAVAGYRQPDLAGELVSARQVLESAGIATRISAPDTTGLSQEVDAALAWAVREGTTNVVRHSRASRVDNPPHCRPGCRGRRQRPASPR